MDTLVFAQQLADLKRVRNRIAETTDFRTLDKILNQLRIDVVLLECDDDSNVECLKIDTTDQLSYISKIQAFDTRSLLNILDSFLIKVELIGSISPN